MTGWQTYDYLIASDAHACVYSDLSAVLTTRTIMEPRRLFIVITDTDAVWLRLNGVEGLRATTLSGLYDFDGGNQPDFDDLMAKHHPEIDYIWIDQFCVAVADETAKRTLDHSLGSRVIRAAPMTV
jgi:hypothetical protein